MPCAKCGQGTGKQCCLCQNNKGQFKWGTIRVICRRCKDKQEATMIEYEKQVIRTRTLLAGHNFEWRDYEKWKKYWCAQNVNIG